MFQLKPIKQDKENKSYNRSTYTETPAIPERNFYGHQGYLISVRFARHASTTLSFRILALVRSCFQVAPRTVDERNPIFSRGDNSAICWSFAELVELTQWRGLESYPVVGDAFRGITPKGMEHISVYRAGFNKVLNSDHVENVFLNFYFKINFDIYNRIIYVNKILLY